MFVTSLFIKNQTKEHNQKKSKAGASETCSSKTINLSKHWVATFFDWDKAKNLQLNQNSSLFNIACTITNYLTLLILGKQNILSNFKTIYKFQYNCRQCRRYWIKSRGLLIYLCTFTSMKQLICSWGRYCHGKII